MRFLIIIFICFVGELFPQKIHVHNDYQQNIPFWNALTADAHQIEIDVILKNNQLFVAHESNEIKKNKTLQNLYLTPIENALMSGLIKHPLTLMIDVKSETYSTLNLLEKELKKFHKKINTKKINIIITGNCPQPRDYTNYSYFKFDYQDSNFSFNTKTIKKIGLVSYNFKDFSVWNGKGKIVTDELNKIKSIINKVHQLGKPIRFWNTPDSKTAWKAFADLNIDYINTDRPHQCANYIKSLEKNLFKNTVFSEVYTPNYESDGKKSAVKNIILMIGDGNGLTQISSAVLANKGDLTLMHLKNTGLMKTQSADDFTTDSAASGTAIATGKKTNNRSIGVDANGNPTENIVELLTKHDFNTGCITTDEIFGATPSAFYAHQKDRGFENEIAKELLTSKLTLFAGGGEKKYTKNDFKNKFNIVKSIDKIGNNSANRIGYFFSKGGVPSVLEGRKNKLAEITKNGISFLNKKNKPFFMMIEAAQIDSYGHHNDVGGIVTETIDFDRAITEAIKFADTDKETLVIVLADHETSGFSIPQGNIETSHIEGAFFSHDHTGVLVPVFAYGPKSYEFEGCYENSDVYHKILKVLNINAKK